VPSWKCLPPPQHVGDDGQGSGARLNAAQSRAVRAAFTHVSDLLEGVLRIANGRLTPFDRQRADLTSEEVRHLLEAVPAIRARMLEALERLDVPTPEADRSARWTVSTTLSFAEIALSEVTPAELVGYGTLDPGAAEAVAGVVMDLRGLIARAQDILRGADRAAP
jgi:hypothetical protein